MRAHRHRYDDDFKMPAHEKEDIADVAWRCPAEGPVFSRSGSSPPLPPMNEIMADSF